MNYEQKYKELVGKIKKAYLYAQTDSTKAVLDDILPELKESEDERIRKEIIDYITYVADTRSNKKEWLAWLEKQETSYTKKDVDDAYLKGMSDAKKEIEKQYEANYQIRKDIATFIFNCRGDIKDRAKWMDYLGVKVYVFEKEDEKPQDEDEQIREDIIRILKGEVSYTSKEENEKYIAWLEKQGK